MQAYEDRILEMLQSSGDEMLEDEELYNSLTESKHMSEEVEARLISVRENEKRILEF